MKNKKLGFSLVELLVAIAVLGILTTLVIVSGSSAQQKARVTKMLSHYDGYASAFSETVLTYPGVMHDRKKIIDSSTPPGNSYSSKDGLSRVVFEINRLVDSDLQFVWNDEWKCYVSHGKDPWGGRYILTEYPQTNAADTDRYMAVGDYESCMSCSIWVEGPDHGIVSGIIGEDSMGVLFQYINGTCTIDYFNTGSERDTDVSYTMITMK